MSKEQLQDNGTASQKQFTKNMRFYPSLLSTWANSSKLRTSPEFQRMNHSCHRTEFQIE